MRKLLPILLLLASCGPKESEDVAAGEGENSLPVANQAGLPSGPDMAALEERVRRAMAVALPDSAGAQYRSLRLGAGGAACGELVTTGKGPAAGIPRAFVVTPDGLAVVASGPTIAWEDPDDFVADAWIRWCATPEELARLGPQLRSAAVNSAATAVPVPEEPDLPLPPVREEAPAAEAPRAEPAPRPKSAAPPPRIDSFFNSVDRPE
ncbi:MAG TPA: hypothetical protein VGB70_08360 [Allosphingosinicella sp.]|jgi:hypothetical protein